MVYAKDFTAMIEGVREQALKAGIMTPASFDQGIADLYRTAKKMESSATRSSRHRLSVRQIKAENRVSGHAPRHLSTAGFRVALDSVPVPRWAPKRAATVWMRFAGSGKARSPSCCPIAVRCADHSPVYEYGQQNGHVLLRIATGKSGACA